jgi:hypothetical protein
MARAEINYQIVSLPTRNVNNTVDGFPSSFLTTTNPLQNIKKQ